VIETRLVRSWTGSLVEATAGAIPIWLSKEL
jgi:hypothetical protein